MDSRQERKLGGNAHEPAELDSLVADAPGRCQIDAERFLREEVLACAQHIQIEAFVKVMGNGDVNDVDVRAGQHRPVVGVEMDDRGNLSEPVESVRIDVADRNELGADRAVKEGEPTSEGAGDFAAHQARTDHGDPGSKERI